MGKGRIERKRREIRKRGGREMEEEGWEREPSERRERWGEIEEG